MKTNVEGPKPMMGSKYINPSKEIKPARTLEEAFLLEKNGAGEASPEPFAKKVLTVIIPARIRRMMEASKGKSPPPGDLKDPIG